MKIPIIFLLLVFTLTNSKGQPEKKILKNLKSYKDVQAYNKGDNPYTITNFHINSGNELNENQKAIFGIDKKIFNFNGFWLKKMKQEEYIGSCVRYLYLDGSKLSLDRINTLRDSILTLYHQDPTEENFINLVNQFTMDGNENGGLLNWYNSKSMVKAFSEAVIAGEKNSVFLIDVPDRKWYYLVFKIDDEKPIKMKSYIVIESKDKDSR